MNLLLESTPTYFETQIPPPIFSINLNLLAMKNVASILYAVVMWCGLFCTMLVKTPTEFAVLVCVLVLFSGVWYIIVNKPKSL